MILNRRLLHLVRTHVIAHPHTYDPYGFITARGHSFDEILDGAVTPTEALTSTDLRADLAGLVMLVDGGPLPGRTSGWSLYAADLLGVRRGEHGLWPFRMSEWPRWACSGRPTDAACLADILWSIGECDGDLDQAYVHTAIAA